MGAYTRSGAANTVSQIETFLFGDAGAPDGFDTHRLSIGFCDDSQKVTLGGASVGGSAIARLGVASAGVA